jgi:hypothetical protein
MHGAREQKSAHAVGEIKIHKRERKRASARERKLKLSPG